MKSFSQIYFSHTVGRTCMTSFLRRDRRSTSSTEKFFGRHGGDGENISAVEALGVHQWLLKLRNVMKRVAYC
jgi:hypothetical protein